MDRTAPLFTSRFGATGPGVGKRVLILRSIPSRLDQVPNAFRQKAFEVMNVSNYGDAHSGLRSCDLLLLELDRDEKALMLICYMRQLLRGPNLPILVSASLETPNSHAFFREQDPATFAVIRSSRPSDIVDCAPRLLGLVPTPTTPRSVFVEESNPFCLLR